jgi:hypothetical protein
VLSVASGGPVVARRVDEDADFDARTAVWAWSWSGSAPGNGVVAVRAGVAGRAFSSSSLQLAATPVVLSSGMPDHAGAVNGSGGGKAREGPEGEQLAQLAGSIEQASARVGGARDLLAAWEVPETCWPRPDLPLDTPSDLRTREFVRVGTADRAHR